MCTYYGKKIFINYNPYCKQSKTKFVNICNYFRQLLKLRLNATCFSILQFYNIFRKSNAMNLT